MPVKMIVVHNQPSAQAALLGPLDAECGEVLERRASALLEEGCLLVHLDLAGISSADDAGLTALARTRRRFAEVAGRLHLVGLDTDLEIRLATLELTLSEGDWSDKEWASGSGLVAEDDVG